MLGIIRYRNVVDPSTGPIIRLTSWKNDHNILGEYYDSVAYLHPTLCIPKSTEIYANGAGGGASKFKIVAIQKAISEALERWAFFQLSVDSQAEQRRLGLDVDPTSTGFACNPSLFEFKVRKKAKEEAIERWAVFNWWRNKLPIEIFLMSDECVEFEIITPFLDIKVFVSARRSLNGTYTYGFSASDRASYRREQAWIEQARNIEALSRTSSNLNPLFIGDKRLLYFSKEIGFKDFLEKLKSSSTIHQIPEKPKILVDSEVKGPWSNYCRVWRTLFEGGETWRHSTDEKIFLF
jgi:hypothetical protein